MITKLDNKREEEEVNRPHTLTDERGINVTTSPEATSRNRNSPPLKPTITLVMTSPSRASLPRGVPPNRRLRRWSSNEVPLDKWLLRGEDVGLLRIVTFGEEDGDDAGIDGC